MNIFLDQIIITTERVQLLKGQIQNPPPHLNHPKSGTHKQILNMFVKESPIKTVAGKAPSYTKNDTIVIEK